MRSSTVVFLFLPLLLLSAALCNAQCTSGDSMCIPVPRLVKLNGALKDGSGHPRTGTVGAIFSVYRDSSGGTPLWQETQNVQLDQKGHYEVLLGAASQGVPLDLFVSGEPRWLGMQVQLQGEEEQPRVSVSYTHLSRQEDASCSVDGLLAAASVSRRDRDARQYLWSARQLRPRERSRSASPGQEVCRSNQQWQSRKHYGMGKRQTDPGFCFRGRCGRRSLAGC